MLDDLRDDSEDFDYLEDDQSDDYEYEAAPQAPEKLFLGMTPPQRFVISVLLLFAVVIMGTLLLLVTGKITPVF